MTPVGFASQQGGRILEATTPEAGQGLASNQSRLRPSEALSSDESECSGVGLKWRA